MPVLDVRSLTKRYGSTVAVRDVSFAVERGEIFGLLGTNGSGKTTTIGCALGLLGTSGGTCEVLGVPSTRLHATRGRVGVVFDAAGLIPGLSVRANLGYARRLLAHGGGRSIEEALELVGARELERQRAGRLSLGQQKRVAVARALLGRPELLVLDEPLSALDSLGVRSMLQLLRRLADEGVTLVVSSHRLHEMEGLVTHAGILARGRLVASGTLDELLASDRERFELRVDDGERARATLAGIGGVRVELDGAGVLDLERARDDAPPIEELNRLLVEARVGVRAIVPERGDLAGRFETLVTEAHGTDGAPAAPPVARDGEHAEPAEGAR